jgi:hypothetical protein
MTTNMTQNRMLKECIDLTTQCANMCEQSIDHCLQKGGEHVQPHHMKSMIDCAEICRTCDDFMLRGSEHMGQMCEVCADVCQTCGDSCSNFQDDKMMQQNADMCKRCADACRQMAM